MNEEQTNLLQSAAQAALIAYAPYSKFRVGAAVLTPGGVFLGANIETASTNLGICAEQAAITHARMRGENKIIGLAVSCPDALPGEDGKVDEYGAMPCGACRQWLAELAAEAWVVISSSNKVYELNDLLPFAFQLHTDKD
ncbi:MAG: cytidine deaminase [Desulfocapsaceae bacterium]